MEKIKEALAKAKLINNRTEPKPAVKPQVINTKNIDTLDVNQLDINQIEYNSTKVVPLNPVYLEKNRVITYNSNDQTNVVFDLLRTQVLRIMEENNWRTIAVVSPTPESGKTFTAINLAISIAKQPTKTAMLVDFDFRSPRVATYLGLKVDKSLNDYLDGNETIENIIVNPGISKLVVLPTLRSIKKPAELIGSAKVRGLINELSSKYKSRIVIFDLPPVLNADDAMVMMPMVDCVLLVVANGMSSKTEIEDTLHHIPKEKLLGIVMNKAEIEQKAYYY